MQTASIKIEWKAMALKKPLNVQSSRLAGLKLVTNGITPRVRAEKTKIMNIPTILLIILIVLLIGALPAWPYSGGWGYYPSGGLGLVVLILVILLLLGKL
jgi:Protein of unknown function (DUF3309)